MATPEIVSTARVILQDENEHLYGFIRPQTSKQRAGELDFSGGKVEPGELPKLAAIRECEEETGVIVSDVTFVYGVTDLKTEKCFTRLYYRAAEAVSPDDITKLPEHIGAVCASKTTVIDLIDFVPHQRAVECLDYC